MDLQTAKNIVERTQEIDGAHLISGASEPSVPFKRVKVNLGTEKVEDLAVRVPTKFKSVFVESSSDPSAYVMLKPLLKDSTMDSVKLGQKDGWTLDYVLSEAYLWWPQQIGKTMELIFFLDSKFQSGAQISVNSGGISINEGSSIDTPTSVTLTAATAGIIAAANTSRKISTLQNNTGGTLYIGGAGVTNSGATKGIEILSGGVFYYRNTSALYGYSVAGGAVAEVLET